MKKRFLSCVAVLVAACCIATFPAFAYQEHSDGFLGMDPYEMSPKLGIGDLVDTGDIDSSGYVISENGHFVLSNTGERIRFWGVNLVLQANFPTSEEADRMAAEFRDYGFNIVRLHNLDSANAYTGLFSNPNQNTTQLNDTQLRRLDYLISALKDQGIYVDLNLHVSRIFRPADGVQDANNLPGQSKFVTIFDDTMISLQKNFATKLLDRTNSVTGMRYADDPAIAMVEITNENMIYEAWMQGYTDAGKNSYTFPQYYLDQLDTKWTEYLTGKYDSLADLQNAWDLTATQLVKNPTFENGSAENWDSKTLNLANVDIDAATETVEQGLELNFPKPQYTSPSNYGGLVQSGISVTYGEMYTLKFEAKTETDISCRVYMNNGSLNLGLSQVYSMKASDDWVEYTATFSPYWTNPNSYLHIMFEDNATNKVHLRKVSLERVSGGVSSVEGGDELVKNPEFSEFDSGEAEHWEAKTLNLAQVDVEPATTDVPQGLELSFTKPRYTSPSNYGGVVQSGISVSYGESYTLKFRVKTENNVNCLAYLNNGSANLGLNQSYALKAADGWKEYTATFSPYWSNSNSYLHIMFENNLTNTVQVSEISLEQNPREVAAGSVAAAGEEDLSSIPRIAYTDRMKYNATAAADAYEFYYRLDEEYNNQMLSHIKDDLGFQGSVSTDNLYSAPAGVMAQSQGDFLNAHNYFDHVTFPGTPWDPSNYRVTNDSPLKVESAASDDWDAMLPKLALSAVADKPFAVTEWNICFPNQYDYELPYVLAAYASLQDWDALMVFSYSHGTDQPSQGVQNWFDVKANPAKLGLLATAGIAFRRGDVQTAASPVVVSYSDEAVFGAAHSNLYERSYFLPDGKLSSNLLLYTGIRKEFHQDYNSTATDIQSQLGTSSSAMKRWGTTTSDTGELSINSSQFTADTPRFQAAVGGNNGISLSNTTFQLQEASAASVVSLDGQDIANSQRLLLTVVGQTKNEGADRSSLDWGTDTDGDGVVSVLTQKISGTVKIKFEGEDVTPARARVSAISETGERVAIPTSVESSTGQSQDDAAAEQKKDTLVIALPASGSSFLYDIDLDPQDAPAPVEEEETEPAITATVDDQEADFDLYEGDDYILLDPHDTGDSLTATLTGGTLAGIAEQGKVFRILLSDNAYAEMPNIDSLRAYAKNLRYDFEASKLTLGLETVYDTDDLDAVIQERFDYIMRTTPLFKITLLIENKDGSEFDLSLYSMFNAGIKTQFSQTDQNYVAGYNPSGGYMNLVNSQVLVMESVIYRAYQQNPNSIYYSLIPLSLKDLFEAETQVEPVEEEPVEELPVEPEEELSESEPEEESSEASEEESESEEESSEASEEESEPEEESSEASEEESEPEEEEEETVDILIPDMDVPLIANPGSSSDPFGALLILPELSSSTMGVTIAVVIAAAILATLLYFQYKEQLADWMRRRSK